MKPAFCTIAAGLLLAVQAPAQSPAPPQTYAFTATSGLFGPMTLTVNRNGSKELIEIAGAPGGLRLRVLYDFEAHRIYTTDLDAGTCTTQAYSSAYAPALHDPIGGVHEMAAATQSLQTIRREAVNGIGAKLVEATMPDGGGKVRIWLEEKFGFPVKQVVLVKGGPEKTLFEMRGISYAPPPAAKLFIAPAQCTRVGGVSNANGGSVEMDVKVNTQGQAVVGDGSSGRQGASAAKPGAQAGDPNRLAGKWDFAGKDGSGTEWRGTLTVGKVEPNTFDMTSYSNVCDLELSSANSGKGVSGPCLYDPRTKTLSLVGGQDPNKFSFTAVLSADGARLTQGRWVEGGSANGAWSASRKSGGAVKR